MTLTRPNLLTQQFLRSRTATALLAIVRRTIARGAVAPVATMVLLAAQSATAQSVNAQTATGIVPATSMATSALRPGDGLRIRIFREPELSGEFVVDERGIVVLPKLGEWKASGVSADSVRPQLVAAYKKYLTTDAIEITPFRRVAVTGAVLKPGLYPIDPSMSVGDAIILAGGVAPMGKKNVVELRLADSQTGERIGSEKRLWDSPAGGVRQLYVPPESWLKRNLTTAVSVGVSLLTAIALLINTSR